MEIFVLSIGLIIIILWFVLHPGRMPYKYFKHIDGVNHAHRGLHNKEMTIAENSLASFEAAVNAGYGIELDIQLSKDGQIVVFHDDTLNRVCGIDGNVCDFEANELQEMKLLNTEQTIPLFTQVLELVQGKVNLIVELKTGQTNDELCAKTYEILKKYKGPFCVQSFNPHIVAWFRKNAPEFVRGQLTNNPASFKPGKWIQRMLLGCVLTNFLSRPHYIAHGMMKKTLFVKLAELMGAVRICWTVRDTDNIEKRQHENEALIFEFYTPKARYNDD